VVRDAVAKGELGFVNALVDLQRRAAAHKLGPQETQGTTVGFSSMARWKVSRHIPILAPNTALMVAHATAADGGGVLGATYDHRVLNGADVAAALRKLGRPPAAG
jgi:pyruvate dehydrogenase E2 component (dihydrolipoamide acetyltransferase)